MKSTTGPGPQGAVLMLKWLKWRDSKAIEVGTSLMAHLVGLSRRLDTGEVYPDMAVLPAEGELESRYE